MVKKSKNESCCSSIASSLGCCKVESLVTVDERGQMVLPKEIREKADIHPGDKLAVVNWEKDGKACCIFLIKVEEISGIIKNILGPIMKEIIK